MSMSGYNNASDPNISDTPHTPSGFVFSPSPVIHKQIGNYTLGKTIGRGAFCKVKIGTHSSTGSQYAVKVLKPQGRSSCVDLEKEIKVLGGLNHPNIISLRDILYIDHGSDQVIVGHTNSNLSNARVLYVVVDLAKNGELFDYIIKKRRVDETEARHLFRQLIGAIEYLHSNCVAHRDLKPENILLDSSNHLKLNDFGLSNFVQPDNKMKTFCGSPIYAAPEVMRKTYYSGPVADVWSLGVILFAMVTGCLPWKLNANTNRIENVDDLLAGKFDIPSDVALSIECTSLLGRMLVPDPNKRSTLGEVRKHAWTNKGYTDYSPRYFQPTPVVTELDKVVLKQMEAMGFMQARVSRDVLANKIKPSVTVYHTLLKRRNLKSSLDVITAPPTSMNGGDTPTSLSSPSSSPFPAISLMDPLSYASSISSTSTASSSVSSPMATPPASPRFGGSVSVFIPQSPQSPHKKPNFLVAEMSEMDIKRETASKQSRRRSTGTNEDNILTSPSSSAEDGKKRGIFSKIFRKRTSSSDLSQLDGE
eukprot:TRINITY_DN4464_c0_g1_i1.p1 TRINITY_DN4464_c0_g1~~TRINITY_DN4464_c0_g1_i1.p1  ORF type:complete len:533 (+),score=84.65 TRINITY_DN4464_c0_g1_i1:142-1740(+)